MQRPNVLNTLLDDANGVKYELIAYRALDHAEMIRLVRAFWASKPKRKKLKRGTVLRIETTIGGRDSIDAFG